MATRVRLPTKFSVVATVFGYNANDWQDINTTYLENAIAMRNIVTGENLSQIPVVVQYKEGVFDAFDGKTDRMWTVTMKSNKSMLASFLVLDLSDAGYSLLRIYPPAVITLLFAMPEEVQSIGYDDSRFGNIQSVVVFKARLGFKTLVFQGRGITHPGNIPSWSQVVEF